MSWFTQARERVRAVFFRKREEAELQEEMSFHLEMEARERARADGLNEAEARRRAAIAFGGVDKHTEQMRDVRGLSRLTGLSLDLKLGMRILMKSPGMTLASTLAIAVAVAIAASAFEFVTDVVNPQIPVSESDRLVQLRLIDARNTQTSPRRLHDFEEWRADVASIEHLTVISERGFNVTTEDGRSEMIQTAEITSSFFPLVRISPAIGRAITAADEAAGAPEVAVIGHALWQRMFDGDPGIVGRTVRLGATHVTIIGVMPANFEFPINQELWRPFREEAVDYARGMGPVIMVMGRLRPDATMDQAQAEIAALTQRAAAEYPTEYEHLRPDVRSFEDAVAMEAFAAVINIPLLLFLLVVCGNVATLVFARTATREGELALRSALGASRRRLVLQLFTEAVVLTTVGALIGVLVASVGLRHGMQLFWEVQQMRPPYWFDSGMRWTTILYVGGLVIVAALVIGGLPALKATGKRLRHRLAQPGTAGMRFGRVSTGVIVTQVAICVAFLPYAIDVAGDLIIPDAVAETPFPADEYLTGGLLLQLPTDAEVLAEDARVAVYERIAQLQGRVKTRLSAEPGIASVAFATAVPGITHEQEPIQFESDTALIDVLALGIDEDYFSTVEAQLMSGRAFLPGDYAVDSRAILLDHAWALENLDGNVVGRRIRFTERSGGNGSNWHEVVGTVNGDPAVGPGSTVAVYEPLRPGRSQYVHVYMRTTEPPHTLVSRVQDITASVDQDLVMTDVKPLDAVWRPLERSSAFFESVIMLMAMIVLLFALAGIYALMSFVVAQRSREIGIRAALGANPRRIIVSIFSRAFMQVSLGILLGGVLISAAVYNSADGVRLVAGVAAAMLVMGMLGCMIPALRALRIQPTEALRAE